MKNVIGSLVAIAGLAVIANAQTGLDLQVSTDGATWSDLAEVRLATGATTTVLVRASMTWHGTAPAFGFGSLTWQPVIANYRPGIDSVQPFANQGNNLNGGSVVLDPAGADQLDGPFGRVSPFASTGPTLGGSQFYTAISHTGGSGGAPPGDYLRISRNDVTRWMGTGPTSGTGATNNFNGSGGVACVQKAFPTAGTDPARNFESANVVIFQIALTVGGVGQGQTHTIDLIAPTDGMSRNSVNGNREAAWFASTTENAPSLKGIVEVNPASIVITPAPGAFALLGLGGLVAGRRRR